jgi:hypothetical protein
MRRSTLPSFLHQLVFLGQGTLNSGLAYLGSFGAPTTVRNDTQHNGNRHNEIQHSDSQHRNKKFLHSAISLTTLNIIALFIRYSV